MKNSVEQSLTAVALVVNCYDEALDYYSKILGFEIVENTDLGKGKRWVLVSPPNSKGVNVLLAKATNEQQRSAIGNQTGGRVFLFLSTNDFWRDYKRYLEAGVKFLEEPREEKYATVVVFEDLYGNKWDLLERKL